MAEPHSLAFEAFVEEAKAVSLVDYARDRAAIRRAGAEWIGPCPGCGGKDRFSISIRKAVWHCRQAEREGLRSGGDVIALAQHVEGVEFVRACELLTGRPAPGRASHESEAERAERIARLEARAAAQSAEIARAEAAELKRAAYERSRAHQIWNKGRRDLAGTPAAAYLALRGLTCPADAHLRYAPALPYYARCAAAAGGRPYTVIHTGPALLAGLTGADGRFAGVHTTWLDLRDPDGKARIRHPASGEILPARKVRGTKQGARIELVRREDPGTLILGEGIETCLSVHQALRDLDLPLAREAAVWASIDLGNLAGPIPVPTSVRTLILLGDGDSDRDATRAALARAQARLETPGRTVRIAWAEPGLDFNDMLRGRAPEPAAPVRGAA